MPPFSTARNLWVIAVPTVCTVGYKYGVGVSLRRRGTIKRRVKPYDVNHPKISVAEGDKHLIPNITIYGCFVRPLQGRGIFLIVVVGFHPTLLYSSLSGTKPASRRKGRSMPPFSTDRNLGTIEVLTVCTVGYKYGVGVAD